MSGHIRGDNIVVVETRRRWPEEERRQALNETLTASVSSVARQRGIAKKSALPVAEGGQAFRQTERCEEDACIVCACSVAGAVSHGGDHGKFFASLTGSRFDRDRARRWPPGAGERNS